MPQVRRRHATVRRPRILFLACHLPFPAFSGGRRRELELIARLAGEFDIYLVVASKTFEQDLENAHELERFCERVEVFAAQPLPGDSRRSGEAFQVLRHRSPALTSRVADLLARGDVDLVHVEGFYLMQHVPPDSQVPLLLVDQNVEYDLERQRSLAYARPHDLRTHRAETAAWRRADAIGILTPEDREMVLAALPDAHVRLLPDGADHVATTGRRYAAVERPEAPLLAFLANFGYEPNVDAAAHLFEDILPLVRESVPDVHLWLVGTDPPPEVGRLAGPRVRVTGRVPDVVPYIDASDVMICPLRIGGGMKVKAIEALRRAKPVVSSSVGAQGMPAAARSALTIADDPGAFAAAVVTLLSDPAARERAERRSAHAARTLPTWDRAAGALAAAYDDLLQEQGRELRSVS